MLIKDELIAIGFSEPSNFTIAPFLNYDLGRGRKLSICSIGTPNEMIMLSHYEDDECTDTVVIRNWDYDGYTDIETITQLINSIKPKQKE